MSRHRQRTLSHPETGWKASVDDGIRADVKLLWDHRIPTMFSCQNLSDMFGRQVVLTSGDHLKQALALLPWATRAQQNRMGYVSLNENDTRVHTHWTVIWKKAA
jgi:hypothetical protein